MCEVCGTIESYGKRVPTGRRLCIDCWKLQKKYQDKKIHDNSNMENSESD